MLTSASETISSKRLIDNINEGILVLDTTYKVIFVSNFFLTLTNFAQADLIGKSIDVIFPENADGLKFILQSNDRKPTDKLYTDIITKEKKRIPVRISLSSDKGDNNHPQYLVFIKDGSNYQRIRKDILRKTLAIEHLSKSRMIRDGKLAEAIYEILQLASRATNTERVNAWTFNSDHSEIECIGNFDAAVNKMVEQENLIRTTFPKYFDLFETEMIIATSDAMNDPVTKELKETYLRPNRIFSLMDIPIRIEGEIIGVVCFEHRDTIRVWNIQEHKFGLVIAQMISLAIETSEKQKARNSLEAAIKEQKVLLREVHHRVKNNLTIVSSLLNLQANKAKDEYHKDLFIQSRDRLKSIAAVHELLYRSKSYSKVSFKNYLEEILSNLQNSFSAGNNKVTITKKLNDVELDVSTAIPLALIVNELVTNSYKHAFGKSKRGVIEIDLHEKDNEVFLGIKDNGPGYDYENIPKTSVGMDIIHGLVAQIDATLHYDNKSGSNHELRFIRPE